ncbi:low molecular weight protein-tyrosine-phosphatase [Lactobacillus psittaci]|uniref:protein-tyrosine-phosphatase n=1 Tax=Lactobacillus psittaci DSM 15354 TaxID=1122152 RepID=A0A0R1S4I1_9LACO|nr:low molecular weight protein-tyrosine-phosphatase [Lactobacillus psittaci]KRL63936.1 protein-tyrosine phosphatase [Lactobacillus psittaci DSM 15354]
MKKILFVCHGNICRSPMAEFIAKDLAKKAGLASEFEFSSKATTRDEIDSSGVGHPMDIRAQRKLTEKGIPFTSHLASQVEKSDYQKFDLIYCMDEENFLDLNRITAGDPQQKEFKLLSILGSNNDIDDPWYSGDFETSYQEIHRACEAILRKNK